MLDKLFTGNKEFLDYQEHFKSRSRVIVDMVKYREPDMEYKMNKIPIGYIKGSNEIFNLNLSQSKRILVIGASRSGKTVLMNTLMDRFVKSGGRLSIFDLKGEYIYKNKPLDKELANKRERSKDGDLVPSYLFPSERPEAFPLTAYYPKFLFNLRTLDEQKKGIDHMQFCQFGMADLTKSDFFTFFDTVTSNNARYFDILEELYGAIQTEGLETWEDIVKYIEEHNKVLGGEMPARTLIRTIRILKDNEIIGDNYDAPNMVQDLEDNKIGVLCLKGLLKLPATVSPALVYTKILMRKIYDAKHDSVISKKIHNMINLDEVGKFVGRIGESPSKDEFLKLLDLAASERISLLYAAQDWKRIPDTLIKQASYVFIAYNSTLDDLSEIIKMILPSEYEVPQTFKSKMAALQRSMRKYKDGKRDWLVIDKLEKKRFFIRPVLPLSHFQQEEDEN